MKQKFRLREHRVVKNLLHFNYNKNKIQTLLVEENLCYYS
jgi:hypothetical protein